MDMKFERFKKYNGEFLWSWYKQIDDCDRLNISLYHPSISINNTVSNPLGDTRTSIIRLEIDTKLDYSLDWHREHVEKPDGFNFIIKLFGFGFGIYRQYGF